MAAGLGAMAVEKASHCGCRVAAGARRSGRGAARPGEWCGVSEVRRRGERERSGVCGGRQGLAHPVSAVEGKRVGPI